MPNSASSTSTYTTLMRVTTGGRPYCQDLNDLFAALVIQHGLKDHRYRFRTISNSFVLSEAIQVLGHLQFTHISKTPDPADPSRLIATRTTTTFTMSPHMARSLGQYFATSRLLENAVDPASRVMKDKVIWILTPKAKFVIQDFAKRAQVSIAHIQPALIKIETFNVAVLERLHDHDDMIAFARPNMTIAFKTMMAYLPMESLMADDAGGIETKHLEEYQYTFFGYQAYEWICEYTTAVTKEEAEAVAAEYVLYGWISQVLDKSDRDNSVKDDSVTFRMGRNTMYHVTSRGRQVLGWDRPSSSVSSTLDRHEVIVQRQRTLASRLKSSSSNSNIAINTQSKPVPINKTTPSVSTPSPTATTSSTPSSTSGDSTLDAEDSAEALNGFQGVEGLEFNMPMEQDGDKKQHPPAAATTQQQQHNTDIDEVTERLLQLRANGQDKNDARKVRKQSISRPSSIVMGHGNNGSHNNNNGIDFITSAPVESVLDPHSHWYKLRQILEDPLLRMYFRDFLKSQYCEENVNIWVDFYTLRKKCNKGGVSSRELLRDGYSIYDTYLAPDAPSEVNINHALKQEIIAYIANNFTVHHPGSNTEGHYHPSTLTGGGVPFGANAFQPAGQQMTVIVNGYATQCLRSLLKLYERVNEHICRTMAQDAIPRFIKTEKYHQLSVQPRSTTSVTRRNSTLSRYDRDKLDEDDLEED